MATGTRQDTNAFHDLMDRLREAGREAGDRLGDVLEEASVRERMAAVEHRIEELRLEVARRLRGGKPATKPLEEMTADELHHLAGERGIKGRSSMKKAELIDALRK